MKSKALIATVVRIELLQLLLIAGLWLAFVPARLVQPGALFAGAVFMGMNFLLLSCGTKWVLTPFAGKGRVRAGVFLLILKTGLFLGLVSALLLRIHVDPLSFTIGFSSLLIAIVVERLWTVSSVGA
jgi:hypothetical protein